MSIPRSDVENLYFRVTFQPPRPTRDDLIAASEGLLFSEKLPLVLAVCSNGATFGVVPPAHADRLVSFGEALGKRLYDDQTQQVYAFTSILEDPREAIILMTLPLTLERQESLPPAVLLWRQQPRDVMLSGGEVGFPTEVIWGQGSGEDFFLSSHFGMSTHVRLLEGVPDDSLGKEAARLAKAFQSTGYWVFRRESASERFDLINS